MNRLLASLLLVAAPMGAALAASLSTSDVAALTAVMDRSNAATQAGDVETIVDCTAPQVIATVGGRPKYVAAIRGVMAMMKAQGLHVVSHTMAPPSAPVTAGGSLIAVVREATVTESHGRRVRTDGFTLAVRPDAGGAWKLIGGSGIAQHPELMPKLFPGFPADYKFPPFTNTPL